MLWAAVRCFFQGKYTSFCLQFSMWYETAWEEEEFCPL
jgi:hypothetical protein